MRPMKNYTDVGEDLNNISGLVVDCCFQVHKELGPGFSEQTYEEALDIELKEKGLFFQRQKSFQIIYKDNPLPTAFRPDLVIENKIILELKAVEKIHPVHQSQIYSYLKAMGLSIGLLVNFNVPLIKDGIQRFRNKYSESPDLRVKNTNAEKRSFGE